MSRVSVERSFAVRTAAKDESVKAANSKSYPQLHREPVLNAAAKKSLLRADLPKNDRGPTLELFLQIGKACHASKSGINR